MLIRVIYKTINDNVYIHKPNNKHVEIRIKNSYFNFGKDFGTFHLFCIKNIPQNCNVQEYYKSRTVLTLYCNCEIQIRDIYLRKS